MAKQSLLLAILFVACMLEANSKIAAASTAYDVLQQNNLPQGLLPLGVKSYVLKGSALSVSLGRECNFLVTVGGKQFKFRYASTVSGVIKSGSITGVNGVRLQVEFAWLGVNQVSRAGNQITIQLEKSSQSFPVSGFSQSPRCT
ncbi:hypothetical protein BDA96_06G006300 [Sorghum bicolor]|uniref:Uncharacterized protein n=2 Tax=Sorghum bicolor TaxID=4558 RepID=A0A921QNC3_SORBI|nr:uncharacterized protein LOC8065955 [Sorghum bicolor]EES10362.1 hypothetical protein SORBI_3006G006100 [Sorghum bicolor]KAG0524881.1 hypothetical protein BDA96_06G006300 [Sorghum bicolor]|eukprot:XP_002446034.1 uncharacterized protein LOC8065955 [Sorghum bicolor]